MKTQYYLGDFKNESETYKKGAHCKLIFSVVDYDKLIKVSKNHIFYKFFVSDLIPKDNKKIQLKFINQFDEVNVHIIKTEIEHINKVLIINVQKIKFNPYHNQSRIVAFDKDFSLTEEIKISIVEELIKNGIDNRYAVLNFKFLTSLNSKLYIIKEYLDSEDVIVYFLEQKGEYINE